MKKKQPDEIILYFMDIFLRKLPFSDLQPLAKSQSVSSQAHLNWHTCPYEGKGHSVSQSTPWYPISQAVLECYIINMYTLIIKNDPIRICICTT